MFGQIRHFIYVLYKLDIVIIENAEGHLLHISRAHAKQIHKISIFIRINTFCQTVYCTVYCICHQLGVRFLADSNSWNVNGTPPHTRAVKQMLRVLSQLASDHVLAQPLHSFFVLIWN